MIYDRMYHDGMWNPFNKRLMDEGYLMIARNTAFSPAGDLMRINDSYAVTGKNYHSDPHRIPLNMLSNAASAASNGYPDIIGGTPTGSTTSRMFREYYVRNAMLAAICAGMLFGRGPWLLEHPEYETIALKAGRWIDYESEKVYEGPATLKVRNLTANADVVAEHDDTRGSFCFRLTPGHDYEITGG